MRKQSYRLGHANVFRQAISLIHIKSNRVTLSDYYIIYCPSFFDDIIAGVNFVVAGQTPNIKILKFVALFSVNIY